MGKIKKTHHIECWWECRVMKTFIFLWWKSKMKQWMQWLIPVIPALWEAKVEGPFEARSSTPAWATQWDLVSPKNKKLSWMWGHVHAVPATWEAKVREDLLSLADQDCCGLWWCHCTSAWAKEWKPHLFPSKKGKKSYFMTESTLSYPYYWTIV